MKNIIKDLCCLHGISGREKFVREYIVDFLKGLADVEVDNLGNVIAFKKGKKTPSKKIMVAAHMDEVGFIVTDITEEGYLRIAPVGGIDPRVVMGRPMEINGIKGIVGTKAVHMQKEEERACAVKFEDMLLDIGAESKQKAESLVRLGDSVCFASNYTEAGSGCIISKALDDRVGCAVLLSLAKQQLEYDVTLLFSVQEEIGTRGAKAAAYTVDPDIAVVVETTTASDIHGVEENKKVCSLGKGAVVSYMDRATIYDRELYKKAFDIANINNIPCQTKSAVAGGNDAGAIHVSRGGVRTIAVSVPVRYIHSPACMAEISDIEAVYKITEKLLECNDL